MKRNRFTDEQIIGILKEHEAGTSRSFAVSEVLSMFQMSPPSAMRNTCRWA